MRRPYTILTAPDLRELGRALEEAMNALVDIVNQEDESPPALADNALDECEAILKGEK